jgi:hypothetical protein
VQTASSALPADSQGISYNRGRSRPLTSDL